MALGVFALAGGAAVAHGKMVDGTIWVYLDDSNETTTALEPNCSNTGTNHCAEQHVLNADNTVGASTGIFRNGVRY
ncbi:hypothetical protein SAMN05216436_11160 [bacterium A37T11]|nr:hypothetical protein SAMN05216436_11160 [bacterium A37T11]